MAAFLDGRVMLHPGDCLNVLAGITGDSVDSCVTDPPYHLTSIVRRFANATLEHELFAANHPIPAYGRLSRGFMGKQWDGGDIAFRAELWAEVFRVLKPGAHLIAFGGTRTYHRMACAIEDAGFEIRDQIGWLYGSGFPKSHDVSKGIDRAAGAERELITVINRTGKDVGTYGAFAGPSPITAPATDAARDWAGWGTALKPAWEPIVLARKPLIGTVAENVLAHGTGALNIDGCRVEHSEECREMAPQAEPGGRIIRQAGRYKTVQELKPNGRWPANIIHDGSDEVVAAFPEIAPTSGHVRHNVSKDEYFTGKAPIAQAGVSDAGGSAARFFYTAKADADDRLGSKHPTVKPLDLMQWLVRLVAPRGGLVLDPFAGTGTTGEAAWREGCRAVLIEREPEYCADIERRMGLALSGPDERARQSMKEKLKDKPADHGPLFSEIWDKPFYPVPK